MLHIRTNNTKIPKNVTYYLKMCYHAPRSREEIPNQLSPNHQTEEKVMSKTLNRVRPVIEATVISILLVAAALAVPAAIVYASV